MLLDEMPNNIIRAEFIDHLFQMGTLTEQQAVNITKEYVEHHTKKPRKTAPNIFRTQPRPKGIFF